MLKISPRKYFVLLLLTGFGASVLATPSRAQISELVWGDVETLGTGTLSSPVSPSAVYTPRSFRNVWPELWHLVYSDGSSLVYRTHDGIAWSEPEVLASQIGMKNPRLAFGAEHLVLVWEDQRNGQSELYTLAFDGNEWGHGQCLTCGGGYSRDAALAGKSSSALVVYRQSNGIWSRSWNGETWELPEQVTDFLGFNPSLAVDSGAYFLAWEDARHGRSEIYLRKRGSSWEEEVRITDTAGHSRRPSVAVIRNNFGDTGGFDVPGIFFENLDSGVSETWFYRQSTGATAVSELDGLASTNPQTHGFGRKIQDCYNGGLPSTPMFFATWREEGAAGPNKLARFGEHGDPEIEDTGLGNSNIVIFAGAVDPLAPVLELTQTGDLLTFRLGTTPGCLIRAFELTPALVVSPAGWPAAQVYELNACSGGRTEFGTAGVLSFDEVAEELVNWHPDQDRPLILSFDDGVAEIYLRGGGCVPDATTIVSGCVSPPEVHLYTTGIRSPDVDGNCIVDQLDLDYVLAALATDDFCADLDGSGWVDPADVAIVTATFGDRCSNEVSSTEPDTREAPGQKPHGLQITPQPSSGPFEISLALAAGSTAQVSIHDASGRLLWEQTPQTSKAGQWSSVWNGRDRTGQLVPAGIYFLRAAAGSNVLENRFVVLR